MRRDGEDGTGHCANAHESQSSRQFLFTLVEPHAQRRRDLLRVLERQVDSLGKALRVAIPPDGHLVEAPLHSSRQAWRHGRRDARNRGRNGREMLMHDVCTRVAVEGKPPGERVVARHAQRIQIASGIERLAGGLLRTHVVGVAHHATVGGEGVGLHGAGNAEVHHERPLTPPLQEDVLGRDIAVHQARAVGVSECPCNFAQYARGLARQQGAARPDAFAERHAFHERHHHIDEATELARGVHGYDVRMVEPRDGARLRQEGAAEIRAGRECRWQYLDRHGPREAHLAREVHDTHAAASDLAVE